LAQNDERLRTLEISLGEEEVRLEHLTQRLHDEFQTTRDALPAVEGPADRDALSAEVEELKAKIARFGNFNALALDRLTEVEERVTFLTQQRDDLRESRTKLTALIKELNVDFRQIAAQPEN
jgi:chromosome segregation protein